MKYDKMLDKERHSAAKAAPKRLEARKLSNVRWWLINNKALDSRHTKNPFCTSGGGEVGDETLFTDYIELAGKDENGSNNK
jgi:hypothetical protein